MMKRLSIIIIIFISLLKLIHTAYNPIPNGVVIISSISKVSLLQPAEYGGNDVLTTVFTALPGTTIVSSAYDSIARNLYILFVNGTNSTIYLSRLASVEELDSAIYQLPITFDISHLNKLNIFTADVTNRRIFLTDQTGTVRVFSMSGLLETQLIAPYLPSQAPIRSAAYNNVLNKLFLATNRTIAICTGLDINDLQCCESLPQANNLGPITFDQVSGDVIIYTLDKVAGIYQVMINPNVCPTTLIFQRKLANSVNQQFAIYHGLYFVSGSSTNGEDNSYLYISNQTSTIRYVPVDDKIVALDISHPVIQGTSNTEETCFHGITYGLYRTAVVLAAIFGTIMGIFMCFNALFCLDFFMTKRIIRSLKQQIPHNLMEDRWNKLVEEKYAKLALEKQRKKDDPPARKSSVATRKTSSAATAGSNDNTNTQPSDNRMNTTDSLQPPKPFSTISGYLRRKSESYLSRRRSDDYRNSRGQSGEEFTDPRRQITTAQVHIEPVQEENETRGKLRQNYSRKELLKNDEDFL